MHTKSISHTSFHGPTAMRRLLVSFALPVAASAALVGCAFDIGVEGVNDIPFGCQSNEDCLPNYLCDFGVANPPAGAIGGCVGEIESPDTCFDNDGDGAFAGNCPNTPPGSIDCDDNNPQRRPGAEEICDGFDNNCNCTADTNGDGILCNAGDEGVDEELPLRPCSKQLGVCEGTSVACIGGTYPDCATANVYPPEFELIEASCDRLDNDCDGVVDPISACECDPLETEAVACGNDTGSCTRGIRICNDDSSLTSCLEAEVGRVCESDGVTTCESNRDCFDGDTCIPQECETSDECGANGFCVDEVVLVREDLFDTCTPESAPSGSCQRKVCRFVAEDVPCSDSTECDEGDVCFSGFCQQPNVGIATEVCNGIDDDCDGRIDNDATRLAVCGQCPFNSTLVPLLPAPGAPPFICVDAYEASRPDADSADGGVVDLYMTSRPGVQPWNAVSPEAAADACAGSDLQAALGSTAPRPIAPKRLCLSVWYQQGCGGVANSAEYRPYPYSDPSTASNTSLYQAGVCVDGTLGLSGPALTGSASECCLQPRSSSETFTCDMVGNLAEWVSPASGVPTLAGGSYLDTDPSALSCGNGLNYAAAPDSDDFSDHPEIGFRCCTLPAN